MARRLSGSPFRVFTQSLRLRAPAPSLTLTLFGRSLLLLTAELLANAVCWIVCAVLFARRPATRPILSLALLAWVSPVFRLSVSLLLLYYSASIAADLKLLAWQTIGLRHGTYMPIGGIVHPVDMLAKLVNETRRQRQKAERRPGDVSRGTVSGTR